MPMNLVTSRTDADGATQYFTPTCPQGIWESQVRVVESRINAYLRERPYISLSEFTGMMTLTSAEHAHAVYDLHVQLKRSNPDWKARYEMGERRFVISEERAAERFKSSLLDRAFPT